MDKDALYQQGLKMAQQKGYTGDFALYYAEGYVIGFLEGCLQVKKEAAAKLKELGYDIEFISRITVALEEI